jgi:site-specific recombinase XerD
MNYSYTLNERNKDGETLILFTVYFKTEAKKFVYSTGETIHPKEWDFEKRQPNQINGRTAVAHKHREINSQLARYAVELDKIVNRFKLVSEVLTIKALRTEFDHIFKIGHAKPNSFFKVFDEYIVYKTMEGAVKESTMKRYTNIKNMLVDFENDTKYTLSFSRITDKFYIEFLNYCRTKKKHTQNTLGRNIGLFKTFMKWALKEKYHYNLDFEDFKKFSAETNEVTLTADELESIWKQDFSECLRLEKVRDLFYLGCVTGLRYSDYSSINKANVQGDYLTLISLKNKDKLSIPLNDYSRYILEKYDYRLPTISEQKFREYIKEVCQLVGIDQPTVRTVFIGSKRMDEEKPKHQRVSTHTARRTFITLSLENGMRPEVVKSITGHRNLKSFEKYIKVNPEAQKREMNNVWKMDFMPLKKVD